MSIGYCVKCKEKREMKNEEIVVMENKRVPGLKRIKGNCTVCNTNMSKIIGR